MTFADKVKHVRATLQLSQAQLADKLKVSVVSVNRWGVEGNRAAIFSKSEI